MKSEKEKMIQGEHYVSSGQTLIADRERARQLPLHTSKPISQKNEHPF
ncbi:maltose acetyltransferase domain-containing protein [Bacillus pumilus]|nr:maltose acetyltransferase domain-containing protein [Bacillus pumilus]